MKLPSTCTKYIKTASDQEISFAINIVITPPSTDKDLERSTSKKTDQLGHCFTSAKRSVIPLLFPWPVIIHDLVLIDFCLAVNQYRRLLTLLLSLNSFFNRVISIRFLVPTHDFFQLLINIAQPLIG